jgi:cell division protein FtsL
MSRFNIFLLIIVMGCALSVVNSTNQQRQIFIQLQRAQSQERQLQQDYAQLQYQQSALSKTSRIEQLANDTLKMQPITTGRTQYLTLPPGAAKAIDAPIPASADAGAKAAGAHDEAVAQAPGREILVEPVLGVRLPMWRSKLVVFLLFMAFVALAARAFWIQGPATRSTRSRARAAISARSSCRPRAARSSTATGSCSRRACPCARSGPFPTPCRTTSTPPRSTSSASCSA